MKQQRTLLGRYRSASHLLAACTLALSTHAIATDITGNAYSISANSAPAGASAMRLAGPLGFAADTDSLSYSSEERLPDGSYRYEIIGELAGGFEDSPISAQNQLNNGRDEEALERRSSRRIGVVDSGHFYIQNGAVQAKSDITEQE